MSNAICPTVCMVASNRYLVRSLHTLHYTPLTLHSTSSLKYIRNVVKKIETHFQRITQEEI